MRAVAKVNGLFPFWASLGVLLAGCGDKAVSPFLNGAVSTTITSSSGSFSLKVGDSVQLSVTTNLKGNHTTEWVTLTPDRISVDQRGMTRGLAPGDAAVGVRLRFSDGQRAEGRADFTVLP